MTPFAPPLDAEALRSMYPERDGRAMSDNTKQARWIILLYNNLMRLFSARADVFIAADNLWYPVEGNNKERQAPDVYVVFGRPKGDRGSYMQWLEGDVPLTVVFEIRSPGNTDEEMIKKHLFYDQHGVEEYYDYDPDANRLQIYTRGLATLRLHRDVAGFTSRRLGIRFEMTEPEMTVYGPNGLPFLTYDELGNVSDDNARRADDNAKRAARLAKLGRKARRGQATPEEVAELERLEDESA